MQLKLPIVFSSIQLFLITQNYGKYTKMYFPSIGLRQIVCDTLGKKDLCQANFTFVKSFTEKMIKGLYHTNTLKKFKQS